jgi:glutathione S-transferase
VHRDQGLNFLRAINERIAANGQLCGSTRGLTDAAIMPFVRQFAAVDRKWFEGQPLPGLRGWLTAHSESDLFRAVMLPIAPYSEKGQSVLSPIVDGVPERSAMSPTGGTTAPRGD